jgi:hypothetical protein
MTTALAVSFIVVALALWVWLGRAGTQRGVRQVVATFREHKALDAKHALTPSKLGLLPTGSPASRMVRRPDYRPQGMRLLIEDRVVLTSDGQKLYLSEDALRDSRVKRFAKLD